MQQTFTASGKEYCPILKTPLNRYQSYDAFYNKGVLQ